MKLVVIIAVALALLACGIAVSAKKHHGSKGHDSKPESNCDHAIVRIVYDGGDAYSIRRGAVSFSKLSSV